LQYEEVQMQRIETCVNVFNPTSISIVVSPTDDVVSIRFKCREPNSSYDHELTISTFLHTSKNDDRKLPIFTVQDISKDYELVPIADFTETIRKALVKSNKKWGKRYAK